MVCEGKKDQMLNHLHFFRNSSG